MPKKNGAQAAEMAQLEAENLRLTELVARIDERNAMLWFGLSVALPPEKVQMIRNTFEADARQDEISGNNA